MANTNIYLSDAIWRRCIVYVSSLFLFTITLILYLLFSDISPVYYSSWSVYGFFLFFGLFTITMGFPHPNFGYVSFDRVAQVSAILVIGPIPAAIVNGLASFIFPFIKTSSGNNIGFRNKIIAVLNNSAMMALTVLVSGLLFEYLGGQIPYTQLRADQFLLLLVLLLSMQLINSLGMRLLIILRGQVLANYFSFFSTAIELGSGFAAILFAIIFNRLDIATIVMYIVVMMLVIFIMNQFALMRNHLESIVEERTQKLKDKSKLLEYKALHDDLTGLVNRHYINRHIKGLLSNQDINNNRIYIAFADIDSFKKINDNYSHDVGDEVLVQIAKVLQHFCNERLIIARFGGEEFLLCFVNDNFESVVRTCNEIREYIKTIDLNHIDKELRITISIGLVKAHVDSLHKTLISRADDNLYKAKNNGKDQVIFSN
jgi:diguanylate cyclase (GGDEF)-like protein